MSKYGPRARKCVNKYFEDNCVHYAAASSFFIVVCFLPFLLIMLNILKFFPVQVENIINVVKDVAPNQIVLLLDGLVADIFAKKSVTLTAFTIIFAVYSAGQGFMTIMKAFDTIYNINVKRAWLFRRLKSTAFTFLFMFIIILIILVYGYGGQIADGMESINPILAVIIKHLVFRRFIIMPVVMIILFTLMYMYVPNKRRGFWESLPGGVMATIGSMIFSYLFSLIISNSPQFNTMYGSIANGIFALFWTFALFMIIFFGAEFNTYIDNKWIVLPKWMRVSQYPIIKDLGNAKKEARLQKERLKEEKKRKKRQQGSQKK